MALMNRRLTPSLEVAFLMPSQQYVYLNATLVKEVARFGGRVTGLVPGLVERRLRDKFGVRPGGRAATRTARPGPARRGRKS
jgi:pantetheine-phosphate adenylyltransferase